MNCASIPALSSWSFTYLSATLHGFIRLRVAISLSALNQFISGKGENEHNVDFAFQLNIVSKTFPNNTWRKFS